MRFDSVTAEKGIKDGTRRRGNIASFSLSSHSPVEYGSLPWLEYIGMGNEGEGDIAVAPFLRIWMPFGGIEPLGHLTETYVVGGIEVWQILRDIKIRGKNIKVVSVGTIVGNDGTHRVSEFVMIAARHGDEREKKRVASSMDETHRNCLS